MTSALNQKNPQEISDQLKYISIDQRLRLISDQFPSQVIASSSFGLQAGVMLHLLKNYAPEIPVVFIDTGYLFPETYQYVGELSQFFEIDIKTYQSAFSTARQEALWGKLWEQGKSGLDEYARLNKIEPMNRALKELNANVWLSGIRWSQSSTRAHRNFAEQQSKTLKVYPILDWPDAKVNHYLTKHQIPRHPLADQDYLTMGDWHSTTKMTEAESAEATRFNGEKYECGLHFDSGVNDFQI